MSFAQPAWVLAAGLFLAIPATAQEMIPMAPAPPPGVGAFPGEAPFAPPAAYEGPPCTCPARPGLFFMGYDVTLGGMLRQVAIESRRVARAVRSAR